MGNQETWCAEEPLEREKAAESKIKVDAVGGGDPEAGTLGTPHLQPVSPLVPYLSLCISNRMPQTRHFTDTRHLFNWWFGRLGNPKDVLPTSVRVFILCQPMEEGRRVKESIA